MFSEVESVRDVCFSSSQCSVVVRPDWWTGWCLTKSPHRSYQSWETKWATLHPGSPRSPPPPSDGRHDLHLGLTWPGLTWPGLAALRLFFWLSPGFVLEARPLGLQQIPHNSDNGGKKWLAGLSPAASNRCRGSLPQVPPDQRNNKMSPRRERIFWMIIRSSKPALELVSVECKIWLNNTPVVNNNVMYFNRGNITLLQAVLICDSGGHTHLVQSH